MGNAAIWYVPDGAQRGVKIDLLRRLRERAGPNPVYQSAWTQSVGGIVSGNVYSGWTRLQVSLTWQRTGNDGTDAGSLLRRKMYGLLAHLQRGGCCQLAEDDAHAWAAFASKLPRSGQTTISLNTPHLTETINSAYYPDERELYLESDPDEYLTEMRYATTAVPSHLIVSPAVLQDYSDNRWVLVREAGYYPALRIPPELRGGEFLTNRDDRVFFLDLPLETDLSELEKLATFKGSVQGEDDRPQRAEDYDPTGGWGGAGDLDRFRW